MRAYATFPLRWWVSPAGKRVKALGPEAQLLALYLLTGPATNMLGLFYLPGPTICHETGLAPSQVTCLFAALRDADFCAYDAETETVWVFDAAAHELPLPLKPTDKRVPAAQRTFKEVPESPFKHPFYKKYQAALHLETPSPFQAPLKPLRRDLTLACHEDAFAPVPVPGLGGDSHEGVGEGFP